MKNSGRSSVRTRVYSTDEKVYIEGPRGCIARLCALSAEFYYPRQVVIPGCTFERFQAEALTRGYKVTESHRPKLLEKGRKLWQHV